MISVDQQFGPCKNLVILSRCKQIKHRYEVNTNSLIDHGFQTTRRAHVLTNTTADHYNLPLKRKKKQTRTKKDKLYTLIESHSNNNKQSHATVQKTSNVNT